MEETEAQSPTAAVACESGRLNPPQSASDHRLFSQAGLLNSLQPPVKPSVAAIARALGLDVPAPRSDPE